MVEAKKKAYLEGLGTFISVVFSYWFIFVVVLVLIAKSQGNDIPSEQMPGVAAAPFILPFLWIWNLLSDKIVIYMIFFGYVAYLVSKEFEKLHTKLDEILDRLRRL